MVQDYTNLGSLSPASSLPHVRNKMAEGSVEKDRQSGRKMDKSHDNAPNEADQNGDDVEPNFSDPEDFVDDVKDDGKVATDTVSFVVPDFGPYVATSRHPVWCSAVLVYARIAYACCTCTYGGKCQDQCLNDEVLVFLHKSTFIR